MFQFPSSASGTYGFSDGSRGFAAGGCPIRKSPGQSLLGGSPELIAACRVLHRLLTPGHPPCALVRLTTTQRMKEFRTRIRNRLSKIGSAMSRAPYVKTTVNLTAVPPALRGNHHTDASKLRSASSARSAEDALPSEARRPCTLHSIERRMVEVNGIEPMASWLQTRRSPN